MFYQIPLRAVCVAVLLSLGFLSAGGLQAKESYVLADIGQGEFSFMPDQELFYKTVSHEGKTVQLKIHAFYPSGHRASDTRPAAVFFHGGGWYGGTPDQFYPQSRYLALRGMVAFSVQYRTINGFGTTAKECVMDGISALRYLRNNAANLGIDPDRLAAGGGSAGGHIASAVAFTSAFQDASDDQSVNPVPNALLLYNPVFDNGPQGFAHGLVRQYWQEISPIHNIGKNPPPSLVITGTEDKYLPVPTVERYQSLVEAQGGRCDLLIYQDREHGFFNIFKNKEDLVDTTIKLDQFLQSLGYLQGEPLLRQ